jgi:hypothetical protein
LIFQIFQRGANEQKPANDTILALVLVKERLSDCWSETNSGLESSLETKIYSQVGQLNPTKLI